MMICLRSVVADLEGNICSLAYAEMRTILARLLFNFDMELVDPEVDWLDQQVFFLWKKPPLNVNLTPVR
jgi:cytochrome P450